MNYLTEYAKPCEFLGQTDDGKYKIRITNKDEVIEKILPYPPLEDVFKYDGCLVEERDTVYRLKRYTVYNVEKQLVRVYKAVGIAIPYERMFYETEIGTKYTISDKKFMSTDEILDLIDKLYQEKKPIIRTIENMKQDIENLEKELKTLDQKYNINNLCCHDWVKTETEELDNGRSVETFVCSICEKEYKKHWRTL